jgi:hypothetical protein
MPDYGDRTRWLGDAYQQHYRLDPDGPVKRLALVQTPGFVGEFLLERTLVPAIQEFSLEKVTIIDPCCGTGHLLCQAFDLLWEAWASKHPEADRLHLSRVILSQITGVDLDPLCVELARLRLIVAACDAAGVLPYGLWGHIPRVVWADALLPGDHPMQPMLAPHPALTPRYGQYRTTKFSSAG